MDKETIITKLKEFNKFAEELPKLSFVEKSKRVSLTYTLNYGRLSDVKLDGPDDESIKAFVNDIRRFFQKGTDTLRIYKLIELYKSNLVDEIERNSFNQILSNLEKIKKQSIWTINGKMISNEEILEVFFYGKFSHRSEGTKDIYDSWETNLLLNKPLTCEFIIILRTYYNLLGNIVFINKKVIEKIEGR